jgi:oxalate decarboxylase
LSTEASKNRSIGLWNAVAGHYIQDIGNSDLVFLELFKSARYADVSLNNWVRRVPEMGRAHLN